MPGVRTYDHWATSTSGAVRWSFRVQTQQSDLLCVSVSDWRTLVQEVAFYRQELALNRPKVALG